MIQPAYSRYHVKWIRPICLQILGVIKVAPDCICVNLCSSLLLEDITCSFVAIPYAVMLWWPKRSVTGSLQLGMITGLGYTSWSWLVMGDKKGKRMHLAWESRHMQWLVQFIDQTQHTFSVGLGLAELHVVTQGLKRDVVMVSNWVERAAVAYRCPPSPWSQDACCEHGSVPAGLVFSPKH